MLPPSSLDPAGALSWRLVGPHRGGRVTSVAGHPTDQQVFYFGHCAGGVWKTSDGGRFWENISDGHFATASVGALAISTSDPNVIYAGMGETNIRGNVSHGDGIYRSEDAGRSWQHVGLRETRHIGKVRIHPSNADVVYVAALGHAFGPNTERGVFRSIDGGSTWENILYVDERTGAIDLSMDPTNPRNLYAAMWETRRSPHSLSSGGPGSSLYHSTDGGNSWVDLKSRPGLPDGIWGRAGVAVSPANPDRVWALIEAAESGLFRSDDRGRTWVRITEERRIWQRSWYFMHIFADPRDPETVWILNVQAWRSTDGGRLFQAAPTPFEDQHDLWIDPDNALRIIEGNDGGACVSFNGGASWSSQYNQPTAQFYHVATDNQTPYRLYGAQQDINTLSVPSRTSNGAITPADWYAVGSGESGHVAVHPLDANIVYSSSFGGHLFRYEHRTGQVQDVSVWLDDPMGWGAGEVKLRFQWTFPVLTSRHEPEAVYATSQYVHRSRDRGQSWETISPDLTRNDPRTLQPSGGPLHLDNVGTEYYATIFAFADSPLEPGLFWAGSDDGRVHVSRDDGASWTDVTPPAAVLPEWALISIIEPSPHDPATAYIAATRYKSDDFAPYLLKTNDYGERWTSINGELPPDDFTRVIREDPHTRGLLFAGTETGLYVSYEDGGSWQRFQGNLPVVPIHDLAIKDGDLIAATHGRSFWILDDVSPLSEWSRARNELACLFQPRPTIRYRSFNGFSLPPAQGKNSRLIGPIHVAYLQNRPKVFLDAGSNPPDAVLVSYFLRDEPSTDLEIAFLGADGTPLRIFSSDLDKTPGLHRFAWDMRLEDGVRVEGATFWEGGVTGPRVPPGSYQVRLQVGDTVLHKPFEIRPDPRIAASPEDLAEQFRLLLAIRETLSNTHRAVNQIADLQRQFAALSSRLAGRPELDLASEIDQKLGAIDDELIERSADIVYQHPVRLNAKLAALAVVVDSADSRPTAQSYAVLEDLSGRVRALQAQLREVIDTEISDLNSRLLVANIPFITHEAAPPPGAHSGSAP